MGIQGCCPHLVKEKKNMYCSMHQTCVQLAAFAVVLCIRARTVTLTKAFSTAYHCQCFQISSRADWNENQGHWFLDCVKCKIAANAVHRFFFVQAFPSNAMGKQTLVCKSGENVSTENHAASKMRKENTQQVDLSRNVSNNNYRKLYSLFSLIFNMR